MKSTKSSTHRRKFLMAAGLGTAGAAAALLANGRASPVQAEAAPASSQETGYHVTDHILKYYKTTEV